MSYGRVLAGISAALLMGAAYAQDDPNQKYTPRELFLRARQLPYPGPAKSDPAPPAKAKSDPAPAKSIPAVKPSAKVKSSPPVSKGATGSTSTPSTTTTPSSSTLPGGAQIVKLATAPAPSQGPALGLRYSILRRVNGQMVEVSKDTEFRSGDAIQLKVQTNVPGYLYIINQGSSGQWMPMFPSAEFQGGDNRVDGWNTYVMPPRPMVFDERTGVEKLTLLFAREPEPDLENLIYSLQKAAPAKPAARKSVDAPAPREEPKTLVASAAISDDVVRNKRQMYARDLMIETVTPNTPGEQKEYAEYVVNPSGSPDSRVIADLKLIHK